jgi:cytidyltransferase-like protein
VRGCLLRPAGIFSHDQMKTVFVSGAYDVVHAGHVEFFRRARAFGDRLVVCIPSDEVFVAHKGRQPALTMEHKRDVISSLKWVDLVVIGSDTGTPGLNFESHFRLIKPDVLVVTEDDKYEKAKRLLCRETGVEYKVVPKCLDGYFAMSATDMARRMSVPISVPLRVDFAGGWLDVPCHARDGAFIVNCTINLMLTLKNCEQYKAAGLGGSAAYAMLSGNDPLASELRAGVGWQDPAVIAETGLCVWNSGSKPILSMKRNPTMLVGRMALLRCSGQHVTAEIAKQSRKYGEIAAAGNTAKCAVEHNDFAMLCKAVQKSYEVQLQDGMRFLHGHGEKAKKYCGSGFGGYALYLFDQLTTGPGELIPVEPYMRELK